MLMMLDMVMAACIVYGQFADADDAPSQAAGWKSESCWC